jgi:hypothetical protein
LNFTKGREDNGFMAHPIVLDIETQNTLQEVGYDYKKLKVSVVGTYDYNSGEYKAYFENELRDLFSKIEHASKTIGFNINKFDFPVLAPYYVGNISQFETLDLLDEVEKSLGHRVALDDLARATLDTHKSGHGLLAIEYFRNGEMDKLKNYCLDDVRITRELYEYGLKNEKLFFLTASGKREIKVSFEDILGKKNTVTLSLPF